MLLGTAKMTRPARTAIRFPLKASVTFFWQDDAGETHDGRGQSRDISEHGLFVFRRCARRLDQESFCEF